MARTLDLLSLPVQGQCLIEASAGTGKTYTLAALYLRLVLGIHPGASSALPPLGVEQILVVTFTEAATEELRDRIRRRLQEAQAAFMQGSSHDGYIQALLDEIDPTQYPEKARLLAFAATEMDQAAVYTIHGFCQRMLRQHAFESGALFEQTLVPDSTSLERQAVLDFWREYYYDRPDDLVQSMLESYKTPDALLSEIRGLLHVPGLIQQPDYRNFDLEQQWQAWQVQRTHFSRQWLAADNLATVIAASGVDKRSYAKNRVPVWLQTITDFARQPALSPPWVELERFSQQQLYGKTKTGLPPEHAAFAAVDTLLAAKIPVKAVLLSKALGRVAERMAAEKQTSQTITFDDMLSQLAGALQGPGAEALAEAISSQYPVAMIDEFQDTDPLQYAIFSRLYSESVHALLLIGDPKQAIYAFRGGDIFTYMQARRRTDAHYTLDTNWRSSSAMVAAVNQLFASQPTPFIYDEIPFLPVNAADKADKTPFNYQGQPHPACTFWLVGEMAARDYTSYFARQTALHIKQLLGRDDYQLGSRPVQSTDIAILVRDRYEAQAVQEALRTEQIAAVFLSNRDSVFATGEARELLYILQAVLEPKNERLLKTAIATRLLQQDAGALEQLFQNESDWENLVEEFQTYHRQWQAVGVLPMLHNLLAHRQLAARLLSSMGGERRLTDLLHLGELLQQASQQCEGLHGLLRWFSQQLHEPGQGAFEQQLRLESDSERVTIITIHKSKGLEYNLIYLPFICRYKESRELCYHNEEGQKVLDLAPDKVARELIEKERLAEDLRLLYVALTRAVHACFLGMADIRYGNRKTPSTHLSAIGHLLLADQPNLTEALQAFVAASGPEQMQLDTGTLTADQSVVPAPLSAVSQPVQARDFKGVIERNWRVTSYTALSHNRAALPQPGLDTEVAAEAQAQVTVEPDPVDSIFTFPRGAIAGTFLHSLFEAIDFAQISTQELEQVVPRLLESSGFEERWAAVLVPFIQTVLDSRLVQAGCSLRQVAADQRLVEMEFMLAFKQLDAGALNALISRHDPLSAQCGALTFETVQGMLKGFIDLTFRVGERYFVLDYKSNHLGDTSDDYSQQAMTEAMAQHRYDLQYQLYTLALHRLLKSRLPNYDYDRHMGGVYYLFLRGMAPDRQTGIFYTRPEAALINGLDQLFTGQDN